MKEVCKRCKKHKELAILKPRLWHDCVIAEGKSKDLSDKEKTNQSLRKKPNSFSE
jgi:hypothetical protein